MSFPFETYFLSPNWPFFVTSFTQNKKHALPSFSPSLNGNVLQLAPFDRRVVFSLPFLSIGPSSRPFLEASRMGPRPITWHVHLFSLCSSPGSQIFVLLFFSSLTLIMFFSRVLFPTNVHAWDTLLFGQHLL